MKPSDLDPNLVWTVRPPIAPDFGGPVDVPFEPMGPEWYQRDVLDRLDEMARRYPDKVALDDGVTRVTYSVLRRASHDLAARIDAEAPIDRPVVALVHASAGYPAIVIAAGAAARTLVVVDASYPVDRQKAVIEAANPGAILLAADRMANDSVAPAHLPRIIVDPANPGDRPRPPRRTWGGRPSAIGFTSGSTGRFKGLAHGRPDGAGLDLFARFTDAAHLGPNDTILSVGSPAIGGATDTLTAVLTGGRARILDLRATGLVEGFRALASDRVTVLSFVPSALRNIFRMPGAKEAFRHLRLLTLFGESTLASDLALFRENLPPDCKISIMLASTEAGIVASWFVRDEEVTGPIVPVGYAAEDCEIALVDDDGRNVAPGEVGQIVVRSASMAMGGWEEGKLTPPPSFPDPTKPGYSIFATGDYATMRPDRLLDYAGRKDQQVKIRGLRADLGIVEAAIRGQSGITDVVTLLLSPESKLVAFVSAPRAESTLPRSLRDTLARMLPEHMVPSQVMVLDPIPRLPNHKPDRMRLMALARGEAA